MGKTSISYPESRFEVFQVFHACFRGRPRKRFSKKVLPSTASLFVFPPNFLTCVTGVQTGNSSVAQSSRAQRSENISARLSVPATFLERLRCCSLPNHEFCWYFANFPPLVLEDCLNGNCEEEEEVMCAWRLRKFQRRDAWVVEKCNR